MFPPMSCHYCCRVSDDRSTPATPSRFDPLDAVRWLPVGWDVVLRLWARFSPRLRDYPVRLSGVDLPLRGDLGENMFAILFRFGLLPWQKGLDSACRILVKPGDTVFDVGANVGFTAAVFSQLAGPAGKVLAFEPAPSTFAMLEHAVGAFANVRPVNAGLAQAAGELDFFMPRRHDMAGFKPRRNAAKITIRATTLDEAAATWGAPDFVKIDVEGFEPAVLAGGRRTLRDIRPIIAFEALNAAERDRSVAVIRELSGDGYAFHRVAKNGALVDLTDRGSADYIALPKSRA